MPGFLVTRTAPPATPTVVEDGRLLKADHRTEFGPSTIGDPSIPLANTLTTWGTPTNPVIPVRDPGIPLLQYRYGIGALDPLKVWRSQPSVRKVVDYIARNAANLPWKVYRRSGDNDRERMAASPAELALRQPAKFLTGFKLWHDVIVDACLYDAWCVAYLKMPGDATERLYRISPRLLRIEPGPLGTIGRVGIAVDATTILDVTDQPLALGTGWADTASTGVSPMTTLAAILIEQANAVEWRNRKWLQTPKLSGLLKRPAEAPKWEPEQRSAFLATWRSWRDGTAQGTPILEDGMEYDVLDGLNPADAKDIEGRQLTDAEVASAFHIAPELVGARAGTFASVAAYRQMLYGPALGPRLTELEQAVNAPWSILVALDDTPDLYAEIDREAGLQGSFAEQAQVLQTSVGAPWLTRNEARGKANLPAIEGGDELITPLNVTEGGQASPTDSGSQNTDPNAPDIAPAPSDTDPKALGRSSVRKVAKAYGPTAAEREQVEDAVAELFRRMAVDIDGPVDADAFHDAWDAAASKAVHGHLSSSAEASARKVLRQLNAPDDAWAADVMANYLQAMADAHGKRMVAGVIERANDEWPPDPAKPDDGPSHNGLVAALAGAATILAATAVADAVGFGAHDAAHAAGASSKTWETGPNPRASHASIDGETVDYADTFSIGVMWPGDSRGDPGETAGCNCGMSFTVPD